MTPLKVQRMQEFEHEKPRLKKIVEDLSLDKEMLQNVIKRDV